MRIEGGSEMHVYPPADANPHSPGTDPNWQESMLIHCWDLQREVGVYVRIGHEPNCNGGEMCLFINVVTPDGIFHRVEVVPKRAGDDFANGLSGGDGALRYEFDGKNIRWQVREPNVTVDLVIEDFHPQIDGYPKKGEIASYIAHHIEVAARVTGSITTYGNTYKMDGLGIRDHGWGVRAWGKIVSHRWTVGVFDRDNSFCAIHFHTTDDVISRFGWVIRGDRVIHAVKTDIVAFIGIDGVSNRGGITRMTLPSGEIFEAHFEALTPSLNCWIHGTMSVDNFCKVKWGERIGVGDFEVSSNFMRGTHVPRVYEDGTVDENGWYPTPGAPSGASENIGR